VSELGEKEQAYEDMQTDYEDEINSILDEFYIDLIIYDEVEHFRESDDDFFDYPF